jgi:dihydropteroate synthase
MGVLNLTPDSFADGGRWMDPDAAADAALAMEAAGADIIDIGGESTRPGAEPLAVDEELARVIPVLDRVAPRLRVPISLDTYKAAVAEAGVARGVAIVNDISALRYDPALSAVVARTGAAVVLMHNRGHSRAMYQEARYASVAEDVRDDLGERLLAAVEAGIPRERILLDPGIGFAKRAEHSLAMLARLPVLASLGRPLLVGPSRKSFLNAALGERHVDAREWGTAAAVAFAVIGGAHIVRVHAVPEMTDVIRTVDALLQAAASDTSP